LRRLARNSLVRFVVVGGLSVVTNTWVLYLLHGRLGMNLTLAAMISFLASFVVNFGLNRYWTFESDGSMLGHLWRYLALVMVNLGLNAVLETGLTWAGIPYLVAQGLTTGVLSMLNYVVSRRWIFTSPPVQPAAVDAPAAAVAAVPRLPGPATQVDEAHRMEPVRGADLSATAEPDR
jgi:putative flippase GtrA